MAEEKSIYRGHPELIQKLSQNDLAKYSDKYKQALMSLFQFHGIDIENTPDLKSLWIQLAMAMIYAHVPAFSAVSAATVGRPRTCDKDWKIRRKLLVAVQQKGVSEIQACRNLIKRWEKNPEQCLYKNRKREITVFFLKKELRFAKQEQKAEREVRNGIISRLSDLKNLR